MQTESCRAAAGKIGALLKNNANAHASELIQSIIADLNRIDAEIVETQTALSRSLSMAGAIVPETIPPAYERIHLTRREKEVLEVLLAADGKAVRKEAIYAHMYAGKPDEGPADKIIDVWISKVRSSFTANPDAVRAIEGEGYPTRIETVWGLGYRLLPLEVLPEYENIGADI